MPLVRLLPALLIACLIIAANAPTVLAAKRVALIVGNAAYANAAPLANPVNDAQDMAAALKRAGFEVILGLDTDKRSFDGKIREFARALEAANAAVLFYAGHGLQVGGRNYLVPVDAKLESERDLDFDAISLDFIMRQMELGRESKANLVFLDACRDNPLARNLARTMGTRSASIGQGLAQVQTGVGTFISYSTQPGNVALDGSGRNSPFTSALVRHLEAPGRNLTSIMIDVRRDVLAATGGKQVPWDHSALTGEFYFNLAAAPGGALPRSATEAPSADVQQRLRQLEDEVKRKSDPQHTAKTVELAQARERLRQLDEANKADQKQIFDIQYNSTRTETTSRNNSSMEIGQIQMRIGRRLSEMKTLRGRVAELEKDLGLTQAEKK
jgi:uncharacterized caspase-like protein